MIWHAAAPSPRTIHQSQCPRGMPTLSGGCVGRTACALTRPMTPTIILFIAMSPSHLHTCTRLFRPALARWGEQQRADSLASGERAENRDGGRQDDGRHRLRVHLQPANRPIGRFVVSRTARLLTKSTRVNCRGERECHPEVDVSENRGRAAGAGVHRCLCLCRCGASACAPPRCPDQGGGC
jgi:hypothetical protein